MGGGLYYEYFETLDSTVILSELIGKLISLLRNELSKNSLLSGDLLIFTKTNTHLRILPGAFRFQNVL